LYQKAANNAGAEERLLESDMTIVPMSWSPDGRWIVYEAIDPKTTNDLWLLPMTGDRKPVALLRTPFAETHAQISPDGHWFAYSSNETGRSEVYVQPFPSGAGKWQVSASGGDFPRWRPDGHELFYMSSASGGNMMAVDVTSHGSTFEPGSPKQLFGSRYINLTHTGTASGAGPYHTFAVSVDGQRFLIPYSPSNETSNTTTPIAVVENWAAALTK
jgi:Tol biopolymer transport system component